MALVSVLLAAVASPSPAPASTPASPVGLNLLPIVLAVLIVILLILIVAGRLGSRRNQPAERQASSVPAVPHTPDDGENPGEREIYRAQPRSMPVPAGEEAAHEPGPPPEPGPPAAPTLPPPPVGPPAYQPSMSAPQPQAFPVAPWSNAAASATPPPEREPVPGPPIIPLPPPRPAAPPAPAPSTGPPPFAFPTAQRAEPLVPEIDAIEPAGPGPETSPVSPPASPPLEVLPPLSLAPAARKPAPPLAPPTPPTPLPPPSPPTLVPRAGEDGKRDAVSPPPFPVSALPVPTPTTVFPVAPVPPAVVSEPGVGVGEAELILLIEDDERIAKFYTILFQAKGFRVENARDGVEGVDMAQALKPALILLDVMMPKMNGLMVLQTLRANPDTEKTPVVVLSNYMEPPLIQRALQLGAIEYVVKSQARPEQLVGALPSWLKGEPALH